MDTPTTIRDALAYWESGDGLFGEALSRIASRIEITDSGCWEPSFSRDTSGYAQVSFMSGMELVHRITFTAFHGYIPSRLQIDHLCRNRACCNPAHLEAVSPRDNSLRGDTIIARNAAVTHCPKGHKYGPENSFPSDLKRGKQRRCRACHLEASKSRKAATRKAA